MKTFALDFRVGSQTPYGGENLCAQTSGTFPESVGAIAAEHEFILMALEPRA